MATRRPPFIPFSPAALALAVLLFAGMPAAPSWAEEAAVDVAIELEDAAGAAVSTDEDAVEEEAAAVAAEPVPHALQEMPEEAFDIDVAAPAKKKSGLPQLDPSRYPSQIFWLLTSFALLYVLMSRVALPRVTEVLDMRQTQRDNNLNRAEHLQEDAAKIRQMLEASMATAQTEAQATVSAHEQENAKKAAAENARFMEHARNRIASAEQNIAKAKEEALHSLADISAEVAADIVQKVSGTAANKNDAKKVVLKLMQEG